jgi:hypothetical protein
VNELSAGRGQLNTFRDLRRSELRLKRFLAAIAMFGMALYSFQAPQARASARDVGSESAAAAIRHDLPLLLASNDIDPKQVTVDWVVSDARDAVAQWHAPEHLRGISAFRFEGGKWWWRAGSAAITNSTGGWTKLDSPGHGVDNCGVAGPPPTAQQLLALGYVDSGLVRRPCAKAPRGQEIDCSTTVVDRNL